MDDAQVDTAWNLTSPEVYDLLVRVRGYDLEAYEQWLTGTLEATRHASPPRDRHTRPSRAEDLTP